jgi:2-enoate reductase
MRLGLKTYIKDYDKATLTGEDEVGRTLEEGVEISRLLEQYGYDFLDTDTGTYDAFYYACPPMYNPQGFMIPLAAAAKKVVNIPVLAGGRMQDYDLAAADIEAGEIDAVGLGRPSLADPEYANKVISEMLIRSVPASPAIWAASVDAWRLPSPPPALSIPRRQESLS